MKRSPVLGVVLCLVALLTVPVDPRAALGGWLAAFVLASAVPLGALCLSMMLVIIPGPWRDELSRPVMEGVAFAPLLPLLALPVITGMPWIYPWFAGGLIGFKSVYLSPFFFGLRVLAVLIGAALLSVALRSSAGTRLAIAGLIAFAVLHGILAVDLVLSLDPEFHSSGFGLYLLGLQTLTALAMIILRRLPKTTNPALLGKLLLVALLLWAYFSFMQYFILWSSNLVPGVKWYEMRGHGIWALAEYAMVALRLIPVAALLFPPVRSSRAWLFALSVIILLGAVVEASWLVFPSVGQGLWIGFVAYLIALAGMTLLAPAAALLAPKRRHAA